MGIRKHFAHFIIRTMIVTLMVTLVRIAKRIAGKIDRTDIVCSSGNTEDQIETTVRFTYCHITFRKHGGTYFFFVVCTIPKAFLI